MRRRARRPPVDRRPPGLWLWPGDVAGFVPNLERSRGSGAPHAYFVDRHGPASRVVCRRGSSPSGCGQPPLAPPAQRPRRPAQNVRRSEPVNLATHRLQQDGLHRHRPLLDGFRIRHGASLGSCRPRSARRDNADRSRALRSGQIMCSLPSAAPLAHPQFLLSPTGWRRGPGAHHGAAGQDRGAAGDAGGPLRPAP
jgi:hypothetical protein